MRILVTGGAGFIGSTVVDKLIENNHNVAIIDNLSKGKYENINKNAKFYYEDLLNFEKIKEIIKEFSPDVVYHLAAQIDVRKSVEDPVYDARINILSTINLIEQIVKNNTKHFIFSSSGGAIYGDATEVPTKEGYIESPSSPYGITKLTIEKYLNYYNLVYGLKYTCLRYANVYGPRQNPHGEAGVIAIFLNYMSNNTNPMIFGGEQTRDFVYVDDVANANILALNEKESNIYNIGTSIETSISDLFNLINSLFDNKLTPVYKDMKKGEQNISCIDNTKAKIHLNWYPKTSLSEGLKKTYDWYINEYNKAN
jgi:UDP-glucose 4-epimerase